MTTCNLMFAKEREDGTMGAAVVVAAAAATCIGYLTSTLDVPLTPRLSSTPVATLAGD